MNFHSSEVSTSLRSLPAESPVMAGVRDGKPPRSGPKPGFAQQKPNPEIANSLRKNNPTSQTVENVRVRRARGSGQPVP